MSHGRQYQIGSFHVTDLSRMTSTRYRAHQIADIILHEEMDIAVMQGVRDADALNPILTCLGRSWDRAWVLSRPKSWILDTDHDPRGTGYAFLWDARRFRLLQTGLQSGEKKEAEPELYSRYRTEKSKDLKTILRDPAYGRFTASGRNGCSFELRLICTRIMYNGIDEQRDWRYWPMRQNEFEVLARSILPQAEDAVYGAQMPAYTLLLGDYNLSLRREWTKKPYLEIPPEGFLEEEKQIVTVQDQLTTLKKPKKGSAEPTVGYLHNHDHATYNQKRLHALQPSCRRVDVMNISYYSTYFGNYDRYREEISGHLPIVITISP